MASPEVYAMSDSSLPNLPVVHLSWPDDDGELTLTQACQGLGLNDALDRLLADWKTLRALEKAPAPILGVMGLLNAGKSSLVKQFLSPAGRRRVPAGVGKAQGTQRFVFWLPTAWKDDADVLLAFREVLESAFGSQIEELAEDPAKAAAQYQGGGDIAHAFGVPLIAYDPGLDDFGFCLLDCPDFERRHPGAPDIDPAAIRVDFVRRISKLLSAVIVLGERDKAASGVLLLPFVTGGHPEQSRTANELGLAGIPVFLLLNKINFHEERADDVLHDEEVRQLMAHLRVSRLFGAYHGRLDQADAIIPHPFRTADYDPSLPCFFELSGDPDGNTPEAIGQDRLLTSHLHGLQPASLWAARRETKTRELEHALTCLESSLHKQLQAQHHFLTTKRKALIDFIRDQVRSRDNQLAFPLLPETAATIAEAVADTAPWYAKPAMWATHGIKHAIRFAKSARDLVQLQQSLGDPGQLARDGAKNLKKNAAKSEIRTFQPAEWARLSRNQKFMPDAISEEQLTELWTTVQNSTMEMKVHLDPGKTREFATLLWQQIPMSKKIILGAMGPVLLIGAMASVIAAMFDGGATIFLFFSLKELLISLGLGGTAVATIIKSGESLEAYLIERAGIPFYERLLRAALDAFALPAHGPEPLIENFTNTDAFEVSLTPPPGEIPLEPRINLAEDRVIGEISSPDWQHLRRHILNPSAATSPS